MVHSSALAAYSFAAAVCSLLNVVADYS